MKWYRRSPSPDAPARRQTLSEGINDLLKDRDKLRWRVAELEQENEHLRGQLKELRASIERGALRVG